MIITKSTANFYEQVQPGYSKDKPEKYSEQYECYRAVSMVIVDK
jgi:hypothetical protein